MEMAFSFFVNVLFDYEKHCYKNLLVGMKIYKTMWPRWILLPRNICNTTPAQDPCV